MPKLRTDQGHAGQGELRLLPQVHEASRMTENSSIKPALAPKHQPIPESLKPCPVKSKLIEKIIRDLKKREPRG